jgi:hypothetical protein
VNVWPAIDTVPLRAAPVFCATLIVVVPFPVPDAPDAIAIHGAFEVALHAHVDADAVTDADADPPGSPTAWLVGAIVNVHGGGGAD